MTDSTGVVHSLVACGFVTRALDGDRSGDLHVIAPFERGVLLAVLDGLGHGLDAALAAEAGAAALLAQPDAPVADLIVRCHEAMQRTRGAVLTLVSIDAQRSELDWCGVGNVEAVLVRAQRRLPSEAAPTRGGVVGYRLPPLKVSTLPISPGDILVLATDGISSGFSGAIERDDEPQQIAEAVFARYAKTSDDALVLAARYLGEHP